MLRSSSAEAAGTDLTRRPWARWLGLPLIALLPLLLLLLHATGVHRWTALERLDLALHDQRLQALAPDQPDARVVLIDIDARALAEVGRWPWPRDRLADLLDTLGRDHGPRAVALDMVLAEPESRAAATTPGLPSVPPAAAQANPAGDARLAESLRRWQALLGFVLWNDEQSPNVGALPPPLWSAEQTALLGPLHHYQRHTANLALLQAAAGGAGHLNALTDLDGRLRRVPLVLQAADAGPMPALGLALVQRALGHQQEAPAALTLVQAHAGGPAVEAVAQAPVQPPTDPADSAAAPRLPNQIRMPIAPLAEVVLPFNTHPQPFARWSAADLLAGRVPAGALHDKLVLVGVNAPGLIDQRMTPVSDAMQGSQIHAHLVSALLNQDLRVVPAQAPMLEAAGLVLVGLLSVLGLVRAGMLRGSLLTLALLTATVALNLAAWQWAHWALPLASLLLLPLLLLALHLSLSYRAATGARTQLTQLFGQYVPPELVSEMSRDAERYTMNSRSAELTVLFADVQGFTRIAEQLPAGELSAMMNTLFSHLTDTVRAHRGTLDKYIGDAVMAFWGAPLDDPQHARHAVDAALAMRAALPQINAELARHGWPAIDLHIGVNTGQMVVGNMGSRHRRAYTVMGDAVNLAARLQQACSRDALGLLVGEATRRALPDLWCLSLGQLNLRGRDRPEPVWQPLPFRPGERKAVDRVAGLWLAMRESVQAHRPARARQLLDEMDALAPGLAPTAWQRARLGREAGDDTG